MPAAPSRVAGLGGSPRWHCGCRSVGPSQPPAHAGHAAPWQKTAVNAPGAATEEPQAAGAWHPARLRDSWVPPAEPKARHWGQAQHPPLRVSPPWSCQCTTSTQPTVASWSTSEVSGLTSPCSWPTSESRPVKRRGNRKSASTTSRTDRRGMAANQPESPALIDSHGGRDCGLPLSGSSRRCGSLRRGPVCAPVPEARPGAAAGVGSPNWPVVGGVGLLLLLLCLQHHPRRFRLLLLFSVSSASFKFSPARQKNEWVRKKAFLRLKFGIERRLFMV